MNICYIYIYIYIYIYLTLYFLLIETLSQLIHTIVTLVSHSHNFFQLVLQLETAPTQLWTWSKSSIKKPEQLGKSHFGSSWWRQVSNIALKSSYRRCLGKHLGWSLLLINLQAYKLATLLQRDFNTGAFMWTLQNF